MTDINSVVGKMTIFWFKRKFGCLCGEIGAVVPTAVSVGSLGKRQCVEHLASAPPGCEDAPGLWPG